MPTNIIFDARDYMDSEKLLRVNPSRDLAYMYANLQSSALSCLLNGALPANVKAALEEVLGPLAGASAENRIHEAAHAVALFLERAQPLDAEGVKLSPLDVAAAAGLDEFDPKDNDMGRGLVAYYAALGHLTTVFAYSAIRELSGYVDVPASPGDFLNAVEAYAFQASLPRWERWLLSCLPDSAARAWARWRFRFRPRFVEKGTPR